MRKIAFAFLLIALAGSCFAASIDVPETLPEKTVWSFSVTLPNGSDFDDADVFLDGSRLISFYTNPSDEIIAYNEDDSRLFSATEPSGAKITFLVSPLAEGPHTLRLEVGGSLEAEEEIEAFEIYDEASGASLQDQIANVKSSLAGLIEQYNQLEARLPNYLTQEDKSALESRINGVQSTVSALEASLEEQGSQNDLKAQALMQEIESVSSEVQEMKEPKGLLAGFASLPEMPPETQTGLIALVVAVGVAALFIKFRNRLPLGKGIYGAPAPEKASFSSQDEDIAEQVMSEAQEDRGSGKWAFGRERIPVKQESKRFNIGDLIKK